MILICIFIILIGICFVLIKPKSLKKITKLIHRFRKRSLQEAEPVNEPEMEYRKAHIKKLRKEVSGRNEKIAAGICPDCGGKLIRQQGKYGTFTGCSNYPKCKFILKSNVNY